MPALVKAILVKSVFLPQSGQFSKPFEQLICLDMQLFTSMDGPVHS